MIIVGYANQFKVTKIEKNCLVARHAVQPLMLGCLGRYAEECPLFVHLPYQCSFLFVCFEGLYVGHPYIHLISFEIFSLACT